MQITRALWQARQPMIKFLGKRSIPQQIDHTPHVHPASPTHELPDSFAAYRDRATQHGPLVGQSSQSRSTPTPPQASAPAPAAVPSSAAPAQTSAPYGAIGGHSGRELGSVEPKKGEVWDRSELPKRFHRARWTEAEMEAVESGGASVVV